MGNLIHQFPLLTIIKQRFMCLNSKYQGSYHNCPDTFFLFTFYFLLNSFILFPLVKPTPNHFPGLPDHIIISWSAKNFSGKTSWQ
jgi:hypothetical protein